MARREESILVKDLANWCEQVNQAFKLVDAAFVTLQRRIEALEREKAERNRTW